MIGLSLTDSQTFSALRAFLLGVLPAGVEVVQAQDNRVPEPQVPDFVTMNSVLRERISTNIDSSIDAVFTGSISGTTLMISAFQYGGSLQVGSNIFGVDVAANTVIIALGTGTGGVGTYQISPSQNISSETIAAGIVEMLQPTMVSIQLDVHGPNSADNTQIITTAFRDGYAVDAFAESGFDVTPLYTSDPRQMPFLNEQQQIEQRWSIDAVMECNPIVTVPQQFADIISINLVNVDVAYPN